MTEVDEFFNKQFGDQIKSLSEDQMLGLLKDLSTTRHWIAILKYMQDRRAIAIGAICTMDPVKEPTSISRTQGALSGLSDLEEIVFRLNNPQTDEEEG